MITNDPSNPTTATSELMLECAAELRRLANLLLKEVRLGHSLPSLSSLVAMKPLQNMLFENLTSRFGASSGEAISSDESDAHTPDDNHTRHHPGYL